MSSTTPNNGAYKRRVLLHTLGTSPGVVTETLSLLLRRHHDKELGGFVPTEIQIVTTKDGWDACARALRFSLPIILKEYEVEQITVQVFRISSDGDLYALSSAAKLSESPCQFVVHVGSKFLKDIRTTGDNEAALWFMDRLVAKLAADDDCVIHASIAGGRAGMGIMLRDLMNVYARPQDRVSHVLIHELLEPDSTAGPEKVPEKLRPIRAGRNNAPWLGKNDPKDVDDGSPYLELAFFPLIRYRELLAPSLYRPPRKSLRPLVTHILEAFEKSSELRVCLRLPKPNSRETVAFSVGGWNLLDLETLTFGPDKLAFLATSLCMHAPDVQLDKTVCSKEYKAPWPRLEQWEMWAWLSLNFSGEIGKIRISSGNPVKNPLWETLRVALGLGAITTEKGKKYKLLSNDKDFSTWGELWDSNDWGNMQSAAKARLREVIPILGSPLLEGIGVRKVPTWPSSEYVTREIDGLNGWREQFVAEALKNL